METYGSLRNRQVEEEYQDGIGDSFFQVKAGQGEVQRNS